MTVARVLFTSVADTAMQEKSQTKSPSKARHQPDVSSSFRVADLRGIVPALPGAETDDFDAQINEALAEGADRIVREINDR